MATQVKQRTWTKIGRKFTRGKQEKVGKMLDRMKWHKLPYTMGMGPGMAIKEAVKQLRIPKVSHVAASNELAPLGLLGIIGHYRDGVAHIYLVDTGIDVVVIASDYYPDVKSNPTLSIPVTSRKQWEHLFDAQESLSKAGVTFDSGTSFKNRKPKTRDWELDWSLKGAKMKNPKGSITIKAHTIWRSMTDSERHGVRFGMFPFEVMRKAEAEGWSGKDLSIALMDVAKKQEGMIANPILGTVGAAALTSIGLGIGFTMVNYAKDKIMKNPRPPKAWWDAMTKRLKREYPRRKREGAQRYNQAIAEIAGGIWFNQYSAATRRSLIAKYDTANPADISRSAGTPVRIGGVTYIDGGFNG